MASTARILVVDDSPTNRLILTKALEKAGYGVLEAEDGDSAVRLVTTEEVDLVLLDVMMPGRSGFDVCSEMKSDPARAGLPIIFVTALTETEQILRAFEVGGCDYVTKPFRMDELLARVSVQIRLRIAEEELRHKNEELERLAQNLAEANADLARSSRIDPLTHLLNRKTWSETITREHERFERSGLPYSVVMIDLDHFKAFNDSRGHQAGDECLRRVAECMAGASRSVDYVGRYGGEEFVLLAPETDAKAAIDLAERIRRAIWNLGIPHPASPVAQRVTASMGVATCADEAWEAVLKRADDALYVAKRGGRNMVYSDHKAIPRLTQVAGPGPTDDSAWATPDVLERAGTVLVVDDEPTNRALCRTCLQRGGYRVIEAIDGVMALERVREHCPDVIIMDVMMPNMDGLECTRRLRSDPETCHLPVIIVSALSKGDDILAGLEAGADEYLTKPIRTSELSLRVRSMIRLHRERSDLLRSYEVRGEHVRILTRLVEFCRVVGNAKTPDEVYAETVKAVSELTRARRVSVMIPGRKGERLIIARSLGVDEDVIEQAEVPLGESVAGRVFRSGVPIIVNSEQDDVRGSDDYQSPFFASVPMLSAPLGTSDGVTGVLNVTERIGAQPFEPHELEFIELIGKVAATASHDLLTIQEREQACDAIMVALAKLAEHRDSDTGLHLDRVMRYCQILAEQLRGLELYASQIDDPFLYNLERAVPLHDIGKVAIPDNILLHPGRLDEQQMRIMQTHAEIGARTIRSLMERTPEVEFLDMAAEIAHHHHEWYDGSGYPAGLRGDDIPLAARIAALADVYDALTTKRVYKPAMPHERSLAIIVEASGTQFDPAIVEAFLERESDFANLATTMSDDRLGDEPPITEAAVLGTASVSANA